MERMNRRILGTSIVALILCLLITVGCTFALFTSESNNNIIVSSGKVSVVSTISDEIATYSLEREMPKGTFENGGTAELDESGLNLKLINVTPGDKAQISLKIENKSNVYVKYRIKAVISGELANALVTSVTYPDEQATSIVNKKTEWKDIDANAVINLPVSVEFPISAINGNMEKSVSITFTVEAVQANGTDYIGTDVTAEQLREILYNVQDGEVVIDKSYALIDGETWTSIAYTGTNAVTVNGNGFAISGLNAPLFTESGSNVTSLTVNNLTIEYSNIQGGDYCGAFIDTAYYTLKELTFNNCHLVNSSVKATGYGAGFISWTNGSNSGALQTPNVLINDCSVVGSDIVGNGSVGGIIGHSGGGSNALMTISNCQIKDCKLVSYDDSYRVGAIIGTANTSKTVLTKCTSVNNNFKQDNSGVEIARPEGQSELFGRYVLGSTGIFIIDGINVN